MTDADARRSRWLAYALIGVGIVSRLVVHPWNVTPVTAVALFAGAHLARRWALVLPLAIVAASDLALGWHSTVPFTWSAFLMVGLLGRRLRVRVTPARVLGTAAAGSVLFFLWTNLGVWLAEDLYPRTAQGLWACYVAAVPFFRGTLLGDLIYTAVLFSAFALLTRPAAAPARVAAR